MCGRYTIAASPRALAKRFDVPATPDLPFDGQLYNVAPTQQVPIVRQGKESREIILARWGLIPYWAKDAKIGYSLINARSDTVADKPAFRSAFKRRRCLVAADGFYEWKAIAEAESKAEADGNGKAPSKSKKQPKLPYFISLKDKEPFGFAGLWEQWDNPEGNTVQSFSIITTDANELMAPIHNRMPVILSPKDYATWLDPEEVLDTLKGLLRPYDAQEMEACPVSTWVNSPRNQGEKYREPGMRTDS
jgi:putative SOS response-associated peptidase YedK